MSEIKKINIGGTEYDLPEGGGASAHVEGDALVINNSGGTSSGTGSGSGSSAEWQLLGTIGDTEGSLSTRNEIIFDLSSLNINKTTHTELLCNITYGVFNFSLSCYNGFKVNNSVTNAVAGNGFFEVINVLTFLFQLAFKADTSSSIMEQLVITPYDDTFKRLDFNNAIINSVMSGFLTGITISIYAK